MDFTDLLLYRSAIVIKINFRTHNLGISTLRNFYIADSIRRSAGQSRLLNHGVYGNLDELARKIIACCLASSIVFWVVLE